MFNSFLQRTFLGNHIYSYAVCAGIFIALCISIKIFQLIFMKRLKELADKTRTSVDNFIIMLIQRITVPLAYMASLYFSTVNVLVLNEKVLNVINIIGIGTLTLFAARFVSILAAYGFEVYWKRRGKDVVAEKSLNGILKVIQTVIWAMAIVFFLDNMGFKISAVIAGLGVGGVAVALAAQAVLGDLFSYFAILFDRPFEIGDFIIIGEYLGSVEHIGIKTTRIRSLGGEQLVFSNSDLTNSRVRNYKRMEKRRVVFKIGVTYQTPVEKLKKISVMIKDIINGIKDTVFDRAHFSQYGDFSLIYEVVYYVLGGDYNKYMDIQEEINLAIGEKFAEEKIEFAYPTQTLFVKKDE